MGMAILKLDDKQLLATDLITVKKYHPEVIEYYILFCDKLGFVPFSGGTYEKQGQPVLYGCITSAYRANDNGAHGTGGAIDIHVGQRGDVKKQLDCVKTALDCGFSRGGIYTTKTIIHVDIMDADWQKKNLGTPFWYQRKNTHGKDYYTGVKTIAELETLLL